jgi:Na+-translocating ferredoxin:NAD+ oxidoreductase RnfC subunit
MSEASSRREHTCYNCLRCVDVCPERLLPHYLYHFCKAGMSDESTTLRLADCTFCGKCNEVCPAEFLFTEAFTAQKQESPPLSVTAVETVAAVVTTES